VRKEIVPLALTKELFGWNPWLDRMREKALQYVGPSLMWVVKILPPSTYYPIYDTPEVTALETIISSSSASSSSYPSNFSSN
jgi:hypothetical protein